MSSSNKKIRVVIAMSGGIDSSVAALLLKRQRYEVIGISLKLWDYDEKERPEGSKTCCSLSDVRDARNVCDKLGIPFYVFNHKKEFEQKVIRPFVAEYHRGRTPNPCILCNHFVKFDPLLVETEKLGADYLATGHYARIHRDEDGTSHLLKAADAKKDQSYVLYHLGQDRLKKILFPIGEYTKEQIRQIAIEEGLPNAKKPESQEICFIPNNDYASFIQKNYPAPHLAPGNFISADGKVIGRHEGIHHYTVGQRRGLKIGFGERKYVTRIDTEKNEVELGSMEDTLQGGLIANEVFWTLPGRVHKIECGVKTRYQKNEIEATVETMPDERVIVRFKEKSPFISPGQAAVFYRGDEVLGGGWIEKSL